MRYLRTILATVLLGIEEIPLPNIVARKMKYILMILVSVNLDS